jgi:hypothetical protein
VGRRFPPGTRIRFPYGDVGSRPGEDELVPERWLDTRVIRLQELPPISPAPR